MIENQLDYFHYHLPPLLLGRIEFAVAPSMFFCSCYFAKCQLQSNCQDFQMSSKAKNSVHEKETNNLLGMREALQEAFLAIERHTTSS